MSREIERNEQVRGVPASPALSHPSGAEPVPVSGKAGIANARRNSFWHFRFWDGELWSAREEARRVLAEAGFSVGRRQRGAPAGILFGDYDIMKWRNLRPADRDALHGKLYEDNYPVVAAFPSDLPDDVDDALLAMNHRLCASAAGARSAETSSGSGPQDRQSGGDSRDAQPPSEGPQS